MRGSTLRRWIGEACGDMGRYSQGADDHLIKRVPTQVASQSVEQILPFLAASGKDSGVFPS